MYYKLFKKYMKKYMKNWIFRKFHKLNKCFHCLKKYSCFTKRSFFKNKTKN